MSNGKIVVGVDGSPASAQALRWAVGQGRLTGGEVHAVISWLPPTVYDWGPAISDIDWAKDSRRALDDTIADTLDPDDAAKVQRHVIQGHPAQALTDAADDADLLVVGSRGHGGFTGMLLGSVSHHVIAHAPCPVVVIHGEAHGHGAK
jgi:nucleotide-binding universal stress UspA family protein